MVASTFPKIARSRHPNTRSSVTTVPVRFLSFVASFILSPTLAGRHLAFGHPLPILGNIWPREREGIRNISAGLGFRRVVAKPSGADAEWMVGWDEMNSGTGRGRTGIATGDTTYF